MSIGFNRIRADKYIKDRRKQKEETVWTPVT